MPRDWDSDPLAGESSGGGLRGYTPRPFPGEAFSPGGNRPSAREMPPWLQPSSKRDVSLFPVPQKRKPILDHPSILHADATTQSSTQNADDTPLQAQASAPRSRIGPPKNIANPGLPSRENSTQRPSHPRPAQPGRRRRRGNEDVERLLPPVSLERATRFRSRREQKRSRVRFNRMRLFFKLLFIAAIGALLWYLPNATWWRFSKDAVEMRGLQLVTQKQVQQAIAPYEGFPLYWVNPQAIEAMLLKKYPALAHVYVRRALFPARLDVTVSEQKPWALVYTAIESNQPEAMLTHNWQMVPLAPYEQTLAAYQKRQPNVLRLNLPPRLTQTQTFAKVYSPQFMLRVENLIQQLRMIPAPPGQSFTFRGLILQNPKNITAHYQVNGEDNIFVKLGQPDDTLSARLSKLPLLVPEIIKRRKQIDWVDLRWTQQVTLHKRSGQDIALNSPPPPVPAKLPAPPAQAPAVPVPPQAH